MMYLCVSMYLCLSMCIYASMYQYVYVFMYLCTYVPMYLCTYVPMFLCTYVMAAVGRDPPPHARSFDPNNHSRFQPARKSNQRHSNSRWARTHTRVHIVYTPFRYLCYADIFATPISLLRRGPGLVCSCHEWECACQPEGEREGEREAGRQGGRERECLCDPWAEITMLRISNWVMLRISVNTPIHTYGTTFLCVWLGVR